MASVADQWQLPTMTPDGSRQHEGTTSPTKAIRRLSGGAKYDEAMRDVVLMRRGRRSRRSHYRPCRHSPTRPWRRPTCLKAGKQNGRLHSSKLAANDDKGRGAFCDVGIGRRGTYEVLLTANWQMSRRAVEAEKAFVASAADGIFSLFWRSLMVSVSPESSPIR